MINELRATKTANFYSIKRRISNRAIDDLFRLVQASHPSASQNLFLHRRVISIETCHSGGAPIVEAARGQPLPQDHPSAAGVS